MDCHLEHPYAPVPDGVWLRGNLHTHSTRSDGKREVQEVVDDYAQRGYGFLALSDHDTLADFEGIDARGMILIAGNEVSAGGPHILHIGAREKIPPLPNRQQVLDRAAASGGFTILNHPNWELHFDHFPFPQMLELKGHVGIEIFNGGSLGSPGSAFALDKWDRLLSAGRPVWGFAHDDSHRAEHVGLGWNVVRVAPDRRNAEGVLDALRAGQFYASTGVTITSMGSEGSRLRIEADGDAVEIIGEHGARLAWHEGPAFEFDAEGVTSPYVRVQCYGRAGRMAWTQPFWVRGGAAERLRELEAEKPELRGAWVEKLPRPNGRGDDPAWQAAKEHTLAYRLRDGGEPEVRTTARCLAAPEGLAFLFRCDEPNMDRLKTKVREPLPSLWSDDSVEIFLDWTGEAREYLHVMANALGLACESGRHEHPRPTVEAAAHRDEKGWTLEVCITGLPGGSLRTGQRWGFHLCRNRPANGEAQAWSYTGGSNHAPHRYGWLSF